MIKEISNLIKYLKKIEKEEIKKPLKDSIRINIIEIMLFYAEQEKEKK